MKTIKNIILKVFRTILLILIIAVTAIPMLFMVIRYKGIKKASVKVAMWLKSLEQRKQRMIEKRSEEKMPMRD